MDTQNKITVAQWNCRGIYRKIDEMKALISEMQTPPDIIMLQETHLIPKYSPRLQGYTVIRKDRTIRGGGVATFIADHLSYYEVSLNVADPIEAQFVKVGGITIANVYIPPDQQTLPKDALSFFSELRKKALIVGDFNAHHQLWSSEKNNIRGQAVAEAIDNNEIVVLN